MYTLKDLEQRDTLCVGQADDLKIDTGTKRVWLSRMTVEDGMEYDNQVTIEYLHGGKGVWETVEQYPAR